MTTILAGPSQALFGIRSNLRALQDQAQQVAHAVVDRVEPAEASTNAVRAKEYQQAVEANAAALKSTDEMLGRTIDILA